MTAPPLLRPGPVLCIGRAGMDFYADPPGSRVESAGRFTSALGGSAANIAAGICRLGGRADLLSCVSDDAVGRYCLAELDRYGIGRHHVRTVGGEARTSLAVVETRLEDCQSVIYRNGASDFLLRVDDAEAVIYDRYAAVIVTGTALAAEPSRAATLRALELACAAGVPAILDVDYRPYSWSSEAEASQVCGAAAAACTIVVGNDVEFGVLAGDPGDGLDHARALVAGGAAAAVYKMGPEGAVTLLPGRAFRTGVFATEALKPTGAGDGFMGGFVTALSEGLPPERAVLRGAAAAAIVVSRVGCAPAMPTRDELEMFLAATPPPPIT